MAERHILYKLLPFLQGDKVANASDVENDSTGQSGAVNGSPSVQTALDRLDATGIGSDTFQFSGNYSAQSSNISEWFNGKQLNRLRCTGRGGVSSGTTITFDLPGTTALTAAFDALQTADVAEELFFVIEYTGEATNQLNIRPRVSPSPQITGTTNIIVRPGVAATLEISRTGGVISNYIWTSIGLASGATSGALDSIKLQNPSDVVWDASANGSLPDTGVLKGSAYKVVNAPSDGSGRFGEVMYDGDWVVWEAASFTSWNAEPHLWFVLSAHDVRRISALETNFLTNIQESPESDRNSVTRGADYADSAGEIRLQIYTNRADYTPADLNVNGSIDVFTDTVDRTGFLAVRLTGTQAALADVLPTLYAFVEHDSQFTELYNLQNDLSFEGNFGSESDYLALTPINYVANDSIRIYFGTVVERYRADNFDVTENNLTADVQAKLNRTDPSGNTDAQRLGALESKMAALFPLTPDVDDLVAFSGIFTPEVVSQSVVESAGYSLMADFRGAGDRYESTGVTYDDTGTNVVTYSGLSENAHRAFGFEVSGPADQVLMWIVDGATRIPYVDITAAGLLRINNYSDVTTDGEPVSDQIHFLSRTSGDEFLSVSAGSVSTFTVTAFPVGATNKSRSLQFDIDVAVDGADTQAGTLVSVELPADNTAQVRQTITRSILLGPLHQNRTVSITVGYELRVSGSDLLVDFTLVFAPSDVTVRMGDVAAFLSYVPAATTTRVDNFQSFSDAQGTLTFTGENEFLISFQPHPFDNATNVVAAAIDSAGVTKQLNDLVSPLPAHVFDSVEIPDTIEFRTMLPDHFFRHSDLASLLTRRATKWTYGLALLRTVSEARIDDTPRVSSGSGVPTSTPFRVGDIYIDTTGKIVYVATGTGGSGDWTAVN